MKQKLITSQEIGNVIRKRRRELGISQERLAEILEVSYQQVQRYENGSNKLNVESIQNVAAALAVPVAYFFESANPTVVAERPIPYQPTEEKTLLKHFRQISARNDKLVVIGVARLAAKGTLDSRF